MGTQVACPMYQHLALSEEPEAILATYVEDGEDDVSFPSDITDRIWCDHHNDKIADPIGSC